MDSQATSEKLKKSPLVLVLAQVRFSNVQLMEKYQPAIQDELRRKYPRYQQQRVQSIQFGPKPILTEETTWIFTDKKESTSITLSPDFVTLSTNDYPGFEQFLIDLRFVLEIVGNEAQLSFVERLGLRYVNLIRLEKEEGFEHYFIQNLLGLSHQEVGANDSLNRFEFVGITNDGRLVVRCAEYSDGETLPPDLRDSVLKYANAPEMSESVRFLDIDHFTEHSFDWATDDIITRYSELHKNCEMAFKSSVTSDAMAKWRG